MGLVGGVRPAQEEDLAGELLPDLPGEIGRAEPAVEARDVGIGLLEPRVLATGQREVADHVQAVAPAGGPTGYDADDDLGHEPDQPLAFQDVQPPQPGRVDTFSRLALGVLVPRPAADPLVASGAERPATILGRRPVAGQQDTADVGCAARVVEGSGEFVHGVGPERIAHLGPVERDPYRPLVDCPVIGEVGEVEPVDRLPGGRVEELGDRGGRGLRASIHAPDGATRTAAHRCRCRLELSEASPRARGPDSSDKSGSCGPGTVHAPAIHAAPGLRRSRREPSAVN